MSTDPYVRETGFVEDMDGKRLPVGVDYDTVTIGGPNGWQFTLAQLGELMGELTGAIWEAGQNQAIMAEETLSAPARREATAEVIAQLRRKLAGDGVTS